MYSFSARDVGSLSTETLRCLLKYGGKEESRNGPVLVYPRPVCTELTYPYTFMYDDERREANPFFHIAEFFHMICGRNDLESLAFFNSGMRQYSDDGKTIMGSAYGYRWRDYFGNDQIKLAFDELWANPDSRRVVISHWDSVLDLGRQSKDIPCNTEILLRCLPLDNGKRSFNITVINRSNDLVYGTFGANVVHFSMFHHYMAALLDMVPGSYWQISNNSHLYLENGRSQAVMDWIGTGGVLKSTETHDSSWGFDYFSNLLLGKDRNYRLDFDNEVFSNVWQWFNFVANGGDCPRYPDIGEPNPAGDAQAAMKEILQPVILSWMAYKKKDIQGAIQIAGNIGPSVLRVPCMNWLLRRRDYGSLEKSGA